MTLDVSIRHRFGDFTLDATLSAPDGLTVLFGRSGSGKTSLINAVAGLLTPDEGRIVIGDRVLFDSKAGLNRAVRHRRVGYVFQDARLFPHMTVAQNLAYGGTHDAQRVVAMLGLEPLLDRRPARLSGGETQRVALGRALLSGPEVLLLDEPLAALDAPRKAEIMPYLEALRDRSGIPMIYVSHDISEVARLATTLVVIDGGRVKAAGPLTSVMSDPAHMRLFGVQEAGSVIEARVAGYDPRDGLSRLDFDGGTLILPGRLGVVGDLARLRVAASDVIVATERPNNISALNVLEAEVAGTVVGQGPGVAVQLMVGRTPLLARVTRRSAAGLALEPGRRVYAILKATAIPRHDIGHKTASPESDSEGQE